MPKVTNEQLRQEMHELIHKLTQTITDEIEGLAQMTARAFAAADEKFATKEDVRLILDEIRPMRRDYLALRKDHEFQLIDHDGRIRTLERKTAVS